MSDNVTMAQIAQQLSLWESTVRYYRDKFSEWHRRLSSPIAIVGGRGRLMHG